MTVIKPRNGSSRNCGQASFFAISNKLLAALFVLVMLVLGGTVLIANKWTTGVFAVLISGLLLLTGYLIAPVIDSLKDKTFRIIFVCALILFFGFLCYVASNVKYALPIDTQILYDSAADVLDDGVINQTSKGLQNTNTNYYQTGIFTNADYFCRFPINIALLVLLVIVYFIGGLFGIQAGTVEGQTLGIGFNAFCVLIAILFTCLIVRKVFKRNSYMLFTLFLFVAFLPLYYNTPNFYTDTIVLAPMMCGVWLFLSYLDNKKWYWAAAAGVVFGFSTHLKMTAAIVVIALVIYSFLSQKNSLKHTFKSLVVFFGTYIAFISLFVVWYKNCGWFDFSRADELGMPWHLWLCVGAHGDGAYNSEDVVYAAGISGYDERSKAVWQRLGDIYSSYTFAGLLEFWHKKLVWTWNDGLFDGGIYAQWPLDSNWALAFTQTDRKGYIYSNLFGQAYALMLYLFGLTSSIIALIRKKADIALLFNLSIFGTVLFLIIFEAAPRRALIAIPFLICCCIYVFDSVYNFVKKKLPPVKQNL